MRLGPEESGMRLPEKAIIGLVIAGPGSDTRLCQYLRQKGSPMPPVPTSGQELAKQRSLPKIAALLRRLRPALGLFLARKVYACLQMRVTVLQASFCCPPCLSSLPLPGDRCRDLIFQSSPHTWHCARFNAHPCRNDSVRTLASLTGSFMQRVENRLHGGRPQR